MLLAGLPVAAQTLVEVTPQDPVTTDGVCVDGMPTGMSVTPQHSGDDHLTYTVDGPHADGSFIVTAVVDTDATYADLSQTNWTVLDATTAQFRGQLVVPDCAPVVPVETEVVPSETEPVVTETEVVPSETEPAVTETEVVPSETEVVATETDVATTETRVTETGTSQAEAPATTTLVPATAAATETMVSSTPIASPTATGATTVTSRSNPRMAIAADAVMAAPFPLASVDTTGANLDGVLIWISYCTFQDDGSRTCNESGDTFYIQDNPNYVATSIPSVPSGTDTASQFIGLRILKSPNGYTSTTPETVQVWNVGCAWRTDNDPTAPKVGSTLTFTSIAGTPTPTAGATGPPLVQSTNELGNPINGATAAATICTPYAGCQDLSYFTNRTTLSLNYDQQLLWKSVSFESSNQDQVTYSVTVQEVSPPNGYSLNTQAHSAYYICGEWRVGPTCTDALLPNGTISIPHTPGSFTPTPSPSTTPEPGTTQDQRAPFMQSVGPDGASLDGARVYATACDLVSGSCQSLGSAERPYILNFDYAKLRSDMPFTAHYSETATASVTVTETVPPVGMALASPVTVWYVCGAWREADACDAPILPANTITIAHQSGTFTPPPTETPQPGTLIHHRFPFLIKVDQFGNDVGGFSIDGVTCTRWGNDLNMQCQNLNEYSMASREMSTNYNWMNDDIPGQFAYEEQSTHMFILWEANTPPGYEPNTNVLTIYWICGAWRLANACDGPILEGNEVVFTNTRILPPTETPVTPSPSPSPTEPPVTPSPTASPTETPVTPSPTASPTETPATPSPTETATEVPVTPSPTTAGTTAPTEVLARAKTPTPTATAVTVTGMPNTGSGTVSNSALMMMGAAGLLVIAIASGVRARRRH